MKNRTTQECALIAPIEREARALRATVSREHRIVTPNLDGVVDLLVDHQSRRTVYEAGLSAECMRWNIMKAIALNADQLQYIFPNLRLAHEAQKLADKVMTSGRAGNMSVICLTTDQALQRLKDSDGLGRRLSVGAQSADQLPVNGGCDHGLATSQNHRRFNRHNGAAPNSHAFKIKKETQNNAA